MQAIIKLQHLAVPCNESIIVNQNKSNIKSGMYCALCGYNNHTKFHADHVKNKSRKHNLQFYFPVLPRP